MKILELKKGKEKPIRQKHHWIFSGAVQRIPEIEPGEILEVQSAEGEVLGYGYFNPHCSLIGRMISFGPGDYYQTLKTQLKQAIELRKNLFDEKKTNAYRLINGEGDGIPGLIVDSYNQFLVMQVGTQGIERLKPWLIEQLKILFPCQGIYEKSLLTTRKEEGLKPIEGILFGDHPGEISIIEEGIHFFVNPQEGQKSGFFLDQREMRKLIKEISFQKKVLNCFSYTGGFSLYAKMGGCNQVDSIDISDKAISLLKRNFKVNHLNQENDRFLCRDVFDFLRTEDLDYNLVILDPPAFAKKKQDVIQACRGYKDINRLAMQKMPSHSLLLSCSCSYHVDEKLFQTVLFQAALEAKRSVKVLSRHRLAEDHPINIFHPENDYLKSFLLYIE